MKRFTMLFVILAVLLCGCHLTDPTIPSNPGTKPAQPQATNAPSRPTAGTAEKNEWNMRGYYVSEDGDVQQQAELSATVIVGESDGDVTYSFRFRNPADSIYYSVSGGIFAGHDERFPYGCVDGIGYENPDDIKSFRLIYLGVDLENECIIVDFDDDQDVYLIASTDPDADAGTLWQHFRGFFEIRPDEWPQVSAG